MAPGPTPKILLLLLPPVLSFLLVAGRKVEVGREVWWGGGFITTTGYDNLPGSQFLRSILYLNPLVLQELITYHYIGLLLSSTISLSESKSARLRVT